MQLLGEKIQTLAGAAALCQHPPHLGDVGREPRHFLGDVDLGREERELLLQAVVVGVEARFLEPRPELVDEGRVQGGNAGRHARDLRFDIGAARNEQCLQFGAFARARGGQLD